MSRIRSKGQSVEWRVIRLRQVPKEVTTKWLLLEEESEEGVEGETVLEEGVLGAGLIEVIDGIIYKKRWNEEKGKQKRKCTWMIIRIKVRRKSNGTKDRVWQGEEDVK